MKLKYFLFFAITFNIISLFALSDSISLGANKDRTVFYSFKDGKIADIKNDDWHLAFSTKPAQFPSNTLQSATIRINEAYGVKLYEVPGKTPADFNQIDTTGWRNWDSLHDSDTSWWMGALNRNINTADAFNYGWGQYNFNAHSVLGDSLFLLQLPNGSLKKFAVLKNEYDTAFIVQFANLDNSQNTTTKISKKQYKTKNFVYLDLYTNSILDREPTASSWDVEFSLFIENDSKRKVGVLLNDKNSAMSESAMAPTPCLIGQTYDNKLNAMGTFWYGNENDTLQSVITDTHWKIKTNYANYDFNFSNVNSVTNTITFYYDMCQPALGIDEQQSFETEMFPNPAQGIIYVKSGNSIDKIAISNIAGQLIASISPQGKNNIEVPLSDCPNGIYTVTFQSKEFGLISKRLVIAK